MTNFPTSISTGMFTDHIFTPDLFKRICTAVHVILHQAAHFLQLHVNSATPCDNQKSLSVFVVFSFSENSLPARAVNICPHKQYFAQGIGLIYCSHAVTLHSSAWSQTLETSGLSEGIRGLPSCRLWHACHTNPLPGPLLSVTLLTSDPLKLSCSPDCNPILRFTPQNTQT